MAQPIMGEFNNMVPPMYLDMDPDVPNAYKAIVYIAMANTDTPRDLRHPNARNTGYDNRNDPAYHYNNRSVFEVMQIVRTSANSSGMIIIGTMYKMQENTFFVRSRGGEVVW